jgi:hypothetical protein
MEEQEVTKKKREQKKTILPFRKTTIRRQREMKMMISLAR